MVKYTIKKALVDTVELCGYEDCIKDVDGKVVMDSTKLPEQVDWPKWLKALRFAAFFNQMGLCSCLHNLNDDAQLHHAMLTKSDLMGVRDSSKLRVLHHTYNVILCHARCHEGMTRTKSLKFLNQLYGENNVIPWYETVSTPSLRRRWGVVK